MGKQILFVATVSFLAPIAVLLQGCGGGGGSNGGSAFGQTETGIDVVTGASSGNPLASKDLPSGDEYTQMHMSSRIAFTSEEAVEDLSKSLGVDISGVKNPFSGSANLQRTRQDLDSTSNMHIEGELFVTMIKEVSTIPPATILSNSAALSMAIKSLPNSTSSNDNLKTFVTFFNIHGSHVLSKVYLGGKLHLKFEAGFEKSQATDEVKNSFALGAKGTFQDMVKLPVDIAGHVQASDDDKKTFSQYSSYSSSDLTTIGGDSSKLTWDSWSPTVKDYLMPVQHDYVGMDTIIKAMQSTEKWTDDEVEARLTAFHDALQAVLSACPAACSDHGLCDFDSKACKCDQGRTGSDCSGRTCLQGCGDHGSCDSSTGDCDCDDGWQNQDPSDPTTPCSSKICSGDQKVCHGACIDPKSDCCDDGRSCSPGTQCCGNGCCDYCDSGGSYCSSGSPHCCDATCGDGHTSPGLCCPDDKPCAQWPVCHCSVLNGSEASATIPHTVFTV